MRSQRAAGDRAGRDDVRAKAILVHELPGDDAARRPLGEGDDLAEIARRAPRGEERLQLGARAGAGGGSRALRGAEVEELRARAEGAIAEDLRGVEEQGDVGIACTLREQGRDEVGRRRGLGPATRVRERLGRVVDVAAGVLGGEGQDRREGTRERARETLGLGGDTRGHVEGGRGALVGARDPRGVAMGLEESEPGRDADGREHRRGERGEHEGGVGHAGGVGKDEEKTLGEARGTGDVEVGTQGEARGARDLEVGT